MIPMNDLRRRAQVEAAEGISVLERVFRSGWYLRGHEVEAFEREFASFVGVAHAVGVGNGTDALEIALRAVDVGPASRVATVANAGFYTSTACLAIGATPVYVDIDPDTLLMDAVALEAALRDGLDCVVLTHLYGDASSAFAIQSLCAAYEVPLVEDCAQATGAIVGTNRAGSIGLVSTFSFYPTKNLAALGDAGAVLTSDPVVAVRARRLGQYGWRERYSVESAGRNSRMDELQAAILRMRLTRLELDNARRRAIAGEYAGAVESSPIRSHFQLGNVSHVAHLAVFCTPDRHVVQEHLAACGVSTEIHYPIPDHLQPIMTRTGSPPELAVTEKRSLEIMSVPCFPEMTDAEVAEVCAALAEVCSRV